MTVYSLDWSWKLWNHFDSTPIHTWWVKQAMALRCQLILAGIYNPWCFATTYSKGATTTSNETAKRQQECANITVASCKTHHTHSLTKMWAAVDAAGPNARRWLCARQSSARRTRRHTRDSLPRSCLEAFLRSTPNKIYNGPCQACLQHLDTVQCRRTIAMRAYKINMTRP